MLHIAKMLHNMKDAIEFAEEKLDLAIESRGGQFKQGRKGEGKG